MQYEIIKNKKLLRQLIKMGFIHEPKHDFLPFVDCPYSFEYNGFLYSEHYISGCFYPMLKRVKIGLVTTIK